MLFQKGKSGNPKGCPKGAHHAGRPRDICRVYAEKYTPKIITRLTKIALGENVEQVVNDQGEVIQVPAPVREQINAGKIVLTVGRVLTRNEELIENTFVLTNKNPEELKLKEERKLIIMRQLENGINIAV